MGYDMVQAVRVTQIFLEKLLPPSSV